MFISEPTLIELTLILRSRGIRDEDISKLLEAMDVVIGTCTRPIMPT